MYIPKLHKIWLCQNDKGGIYMYPKMANRHGLIAGATGTGKTVTLKVLAESFSEMGVPVFLADIKGDVSGMCLPGEDSEGFQKRLKNKLGLETQWKFSGYPVRFWDVYGKGGIPIRATVSEMGPDLLSRLLELNETQSGVMSIVFRVADDQGLLLLDFKDLRSMVQYVGEHASEYKTTYGNVSAASIGSIQRALLKLEDQGADIFFGEPALDIHDWFATAEDGRGVINLLHATELFQRPLLYSTFLLWMLSELYEMMPEAGDLDKPKMVFFFDEAHLIFKDAPQSLLDKVEQIVRLIRSKGIGIYFITQQPADVPESVLAQLGLPDMRVPIGYAFSYPDRMEYDFPRLDLFEAGQLTFEKPDTEVFRCIGFAYDALNAGGSYPVVLNGANEVLVSLFLQSRIKFTDIQNTLEEVLNRHNPEYNIDLEGILETDRAARNAVINILQG